MLSSRACAIAFGLSAAISRQSVFRNYRTTINCYVTFSRPTAILFRNDCTLFAHCTNNYCNPFLSPHNITDIQTNNIRKQFYSHLKKPTIQLKSIRSKELIKDALEMRKEQLLEKRDGFVKDMKATKSRVQERVKEKMEIVERENVLTIPNLLCVGRAALSPYLAYVIIQEDYTFAMGLLMFAGFTDLVF